ncbi:MAG: sugar transferase, partial [Pseudomonadota bacterium]
MSARPEILLAAHRIPYPPDKGDKIRSWRLFRHLSERFDVHLAAFVDDPDDLQHRASLEERCASLFLSTLKKPIAMGRSIAAAATGEAMSLAYYRDPAMRRWIVAL